MKKPESTQLCRISVRGVVQGVGFRPFVYRLAREYKLTGWVGNTAAGVKIEVEGEKTSIQEFATSLRRDIPPVARIEYLSLTYHPPAGHRGFEIHPSHSEPGKYQLVSPDIATCPDCRIEIADPADRRYRYPFTNCTNCGPRFTIIQDLPYDRPLTTMNGFTMCPRCREEYDNPADRRFHTQPNACPDCGPKLALLDGAGKDVAGSDAFAACVQRLLAGDIVALKGLGGFLLACDATSDEAVSRLRQRKHRPGKPLAVMVSDIDEAQRYCEVSPVEAELLQSPQSPIVLLQRHTATPICPGVAPGLKYIGFMLPYTPLHHLLLAAVGIPLVMTSGNLSEEPIAQDNDEALGRLSGIADYFLVHNRDIHSRYDDSVAMVEGGNIQLLRRARGFAPYPIHLDFRAVPVLGCGAQEKNSFCLTRDGYAFLSQHIGDMENMETLEHYKSTIALYNYLFRIEPEAIAHDLHPDYLATRYAQETAAANDINLIPVQHHHAHIVSCLADNGEDAEVIGIAFDGTGYGADGHIWGGEFLVCDRRQYRRLGHLEYLPLPGGVAAIKRPYRTAISYLLALLGEDVLSSDMAFLQRVNAAEIDIIGKQMRGELNSPLSSSMGRLFDAVAALTGIRGEIDYEGQAAVELEMAAYDGLVESSGTGYPYSIVEGEDTHVVRLGETLDVIIVDLAAGIPPPVIAARFHHTIARMVSDMCLEISRKVGVTKIALSGGVFQNRLLLRLTVPRLEANGFTVLTHKQVPTNDGGISLGQAVIANYVLSTPDRL